MPTTNDPKAVTTAAYIDVSSGTESVLVTIAGPYSVELRVAAALPTPDKRGHVCDLTSPFYFSTLGSGNKLWAKAKNGNTAVIVTD